MEGFYLESTLFKSICSPCDATCKTCNGPHEHNCLTCPTFRTLTKGNSDDITGSCICN